MIALGISGSGRLEVRVSHGITHIEYHLDLDMHSEQDEIRGVNVDIL